MDILNKLNESTIDKLYKRQIKDDHFVYIARGGQGVVYKIIDPVTNVKYALKVEKYTSSTKNEIYINKLINETPTDVNIIKIYSIRIVNNYVLTLMDMADGSLVDWMQHVHTDCEWLDMIFQIVMGVYALQIKYNIYHSDMKPKNILFKRLNNFEKFEYVVGDKKYSISTKCLFIISDFGHAVTISHSGKYKKSDVENFIKSNADLYELASIYKRLAVDNIIKIYTIEKLVSLGKKDPHFMTYYTDTLKKTQRDTSHLPIKIQQRLILRSIAYYMVEKDMIDITDIDIIPSKKITTILNNILYSDIVTIINETYDGLHNGCGI
jgi:hypothetical protein